MSKNIIKLFICVAFFMLGMVTYRNDWFPRPQVRQLKNYFSPPPIPHSTLPPHINKIISQYTAGIPVFSDRSYFDTIGDSRLESSYILQIPRHESVPIQIEVNRKVKIYRLLETSYNDNSIFNDWDSTDIKVYVEGSSCIHTEVVSKIFDPCILILKSGGPIASSPIIIRDLSNISVNMPITILNKNYTNHNKK